MPRSSAAVIALRKAFCEDLQNLLEEVVVNGSAYEEAAEADVLEAQRIITNALKRTHG